MASETTIRNAISDHISRDIEICDTRGLTCRDCVCGVCAGQCILGLMWQLSNPSGNVDKPSSGACGRTLYVPACYPCVITDGCCGYAAISSLDDVDKSGAIRTVVETGARLRVRDKLKARAGDTFGGVSESLVQIVCPLCFCTPCHNAALIRKLRPPGYGGLWCPGPTNVVSYAML